LLRYEINGRKRWMCLGSVSEFNLKETRERARLARQKIADKIDPLEVRRAGLAARHHKRHGGIGPIPVIGKGYE
jgi:hypothetical protein